MSRTCNTCQNGKAGLTCAGCGEPVCKSCAEFVDEDTFAMQPAALPHPAAGAYCASCSNAVVAPARATYDEAMERARDVNVFMRSQSKESRFIRRLEKPLQVRDCVDREDAILRLAFLAARGGFNVLLDVDLTSEKVHMGGWQTSKWHAVAVPAQVDPQRLIRRELSNPN